MKRMILSMLIALVFVVPTMAQDDVPTEPTEATTEITVPTTSVSVTTENDPATVTGWIDSLAPWVITVVLLFIVWRQGKDTANGIPRETVDTFLDRAAAGAELTPTQMDDFAIEVARKVRDMLYAEHIPVEPTPQWAQKSDDVAQG